MGLETFLERARNYESKKLKVIEKEVEGFGKIQFCRPNQNELLEYLATITSKAKPKQIELGNVVVDMDIELSLFAKAASKLIYNCCTEMRSTEIREMYKGVDYHEIPLEMFGSNLVIELGTFISEKFEGVEVKKEVEEEIKN